MQVLSVIVALAVVFNFADAAFPLYKRQQQQQQQQTLWSVISANNSYSIFRRQAEKFPELVAALNGSQNAIINGKPIRNMTVFVPTNDAWQQIPRSILSSLESAPPLNQTLNQTMMGQQQQQRLSDQQLQQQTQSQLQRDVLGPFTISSDRRNETFRSGTPVLQAAMYYHMHNGTFNANIVAVNASQQGGQGAQSQQVGQIGQGQNQIRYALISSLLEPVRLAVFSSNLIGSQGQEGGQAVSAQQQQVNIQTEKLKVNDAGVTAVQQARNGLLYAIDRVVTPFWFMNVTLSELPDQLNIERGQFLFPDFQKGQRQQGGMGGSGSSETGGQA